MRFCFLCLLILTLATGCASGPTYPSAMFRDYSGMTKQYDLDRVRIAPGTDFSAYNTILISPVDTSSLMMTNLDLEDQKEVTSKLLENFRAEMSRHFSMVATKSSDIGQGQKALRLDLGMTEMEGTNVMLNMMVGFSSGNAKATFEGRLVDLEAGTEVVAFADRKKGFPFGSKREFWDHSFIAPEYSQLTSLLLFTEIWAENVGNIVKSLKTGHPSVGKGE